MGPDPAALYPRSTRAAAAGMDGHRGAGLRPEGCIGHRLRAAAQQPPLVLLRVVRRRIGAARRLALVAKRPRRHRARFKKAGMKNPATRAGNTKDETATRQVGEHPPRQPSRTSLH